MEKTGYKYDVFISHAVEDKIPIAIELEKRLKEKGLSIWYSGTELSVGDRLTESIYKNLELCRFGVVIISPTYLSKIWTLNEFFFLLTREKDGQKVILPVLYDITPSELAARSNLMAEIFAVRADKGLDHVTEILFKEIRKHQAIETKSKKTFFAGLFTRKTILAAIILLTVAVGGYGFFHWYPTAPQKEVIEQSINKRIRDLQQKAEIELQQSLLAGKGTSVKPDDFKKTYTEFSNARSYYRNEYTVNTGLEFIRSKRNVEASLALDLDLLSPINLFTLTSPELYRCDSLSTTVFREEKYILKNTQPVTHTITTSESVDDQYLVTVNYTHSIRLIQTVLVFPSSTRDTKRYQLTLIALRPTETYSFTHQDGDWILSTVQ